MTWQRYNDPEFYQLKAAWMKARERHTINSHHGYEMSRALAALLGIEYKHDGDFELLPYSMIPLLEALAGPHGEAVLKAYRIKKGLENCDNNVAIQPRG